MPAIILAVAIPALLALAVSAVTIAWLLRSRAAALVLDHPNHRSLHAAPTPRIGGIGILAGMLAAFACADFAIDLRLLLAIALLAAISLLDDVRDIGASGRMLTHLLCAGLAVWTLAISPDNIWLALLAALAIAWMTNLYNFMDGSDGLAGSMAVFGFGSYGIAALFANDLGFAALNFSVAAAATGFLLFNFPPARIFMGDAGAIPLGFLAAVCGMDGWNRGDWPLWLGIVVFSPFIVDASLTLARRLLRGARVWQAHREHYYQRLVQAGCGHRATLLMECGLMLLVCTIALVSTQLDPALHPAALFVVAAIYMCLIGMLEYRLPRLMQHA